MTGWWDESVIKLRMGVAALENMRFVYSPLAEVAESLYMIHTGRIHPMHRGWFDEAADTIRATDSDLLRACIPTSGYLAPFLLGVSDSTSVTIDDQLDRLAGTPVAQLGDGLRTAWQSDPIPGPVHELLADPSAGRRLADDLHRYWTASIQPHWSQMRALLDADVAYRASRLTQGGFAALLNDLHPSLELRDHSIEIVGRAQPTDHDLSDAGLLLMPCVFAYPHIIVEPGTAGPPSLTYGPRGIATLWQGTVPMDEDDALGTLLGRSRAAILMTVDLPMSTTEIAAALSQSPPAVSVHLSILRRCGFVTSWRAGRRVLYQRTPLATSVINASLPDVQLDQGRGA